ncbi:MAG: hypothetical protein HN725_09900, partial [Alphaproteobacteria bacterium]|nr:hypothetical protein [Alphaproteobacteria bacterium]
MTGHDIPMVLKGITDTVSDDVNEAVKPATAVAGYSALPEQLSLSPEKLLDGFDGPAAILDRRGKLIG